MIRMIHGTYSYYERGAVVIETAGGVGYRIFVPDTSKLLLAREGDEVTVYTHLQVKEDEMSLYGFADSEALALFEQLITVNGVGPKAGMAIMSLGTPNQIKSHIVGKDGRYIAQASGVGKKTAERVILELCDKVTALPIEGIEEPVPVAKAVSDERSGAIVALTTLGYSKSEAERAINSVPDDGLTIEDYIKRALKYL